MGRVKIQILFNKILKGKERNLNWIQFLQLMKLVKASSLQDKINLFTILADEDGNESLSYDEIENLAEISITSNFIFDKARDRKFIKMMVDYFSKFIFKLCKTEISEEISIQQIRNVISSKQSEYDLILFFCGAD